MVAQYHSQQLPLQITSSPPSLTHLPPPAHPPFSLSRVCSCVYVCMCECACIYTASTNVCACLWMYSNRSSSVCNLLVFKQHTNQFATGTRRACVHSFSTCTLSHILISTCPMPTCRIQWLLPSSQEAVDITTALKHV